MNNLFYLALFGFCLVTAQVSGRRPRPDRQDICNYRCNSFYDLVCALDLDDYAENTKLFPNVCMMQSFNCLNNANFKEVTLSNCFDPYDKPLGSSKPALGSSGSS